MAVDVLPLLAKFDDFRDHETQRAYFRTQVPWIGQNAYLNVVFKGAPKDALRQITRELAMPISLTEFLAVQNGANLFSGAMSVYGIHHPGQLLYRADAFFDLPFNIEDENSSWPPYDSERCLAIGGYSFDGSTICVDRGDSRIFLFRRGQGRLLATPERSWPSLDEWITSEITRLGFLFDRTGRRLVDESQTLPLNERAS